MGGNKSKGSVSKTGGGSKKSGKTSSKPSGAALGRPSSGFSAPSASAPTPPPSAADGSSAAASAAPVEELPPTVGQRTAHIRNKFVRAKLYQELKHKEDRKKKSERKARARDAQEREARGETVVRAVPRTIENQRAADVTVAGPEDEENAAEEDVDEFAGHFALEREPKVLLTTSLTATKTTYAFASELLDVLPRCVFYKRNGYALKKICEFAERRGFSDVVVVHEDRHDVVGLLVTHLPDGPTARFALSRLVLGQKIRGSAVATSHRPELALNNFSTKLGTRVGRLFASLFHQDPNFRGRRVATFHAQRDYIFFRHHRYIFEAKDTPKPGSELEQQLKAAAEDPDAPPPPLSDLVKVRLQEIGPRFTLRLVSLQKGVYDPTQGEFEWVPKRDREQTKRHFVL